MTPVVPDLVMPWEMTGRGDPMVLVPGGLTGWISWKPHAEHLAATRRVVRVQLLSVDHGLRGAPLPPDYSVKTESCALGRALEAAGIGWADVAAWSYGAEATLDFALDHPERVRSLTLIEPPAFWVLRSRGPLPPAALEFQATSRSYGPGDVSEEQLAQFAHFAGFVPPGVAPQSMPPWPVWVQHRQSLRTGDVAFRHDDNIRRVRAFRSPVLLFKGVGSPDYLRGIIDVLGEEFPAVQVRELPGAHALHVVSMAAFLEIFEAFLSGTMTPSAQPSPARRLRERLGDARLLIAPGVFDGLSARIAAAAGFEALYASGGAIARSAGVPDLGLLSFSEVLARLREIVDATDLPVIADADTGYGNALNVLRTVREFERLGVAALHLEDQVSPKKCGHYAGKEVIAAEEMVGKLRAAQDARRDSDLIIIARTDARAVEGLDAAIRRANLYAQAGADVIFVEAPESEEELQTIAREVRAPLLVNMFQGGRTPLVAPDIVAGMGYRVMIVPSDLQRAAIRAIQEAAAAIKATGTAAGTGSRLAGFDERDALVDLAGWRRREAVYAADDNGKP